ncbi:hypothetical protein EUGRSUZ_F00051 [Eucalyptus grandis]|uniref:Uncharacterized protein n=2 Tax=Eucalyptus grandis TaxID=71139 RepID=A0ACC3KAX0_EUCGR|nr:hypothetical protein EUGRSUZ_F00051 [Eucalyptus grandis]
MCFYDKLLIMINKSLSTEVPFNNFEEAFNLQLLMFKALRDVILIMSMKASFPKLFSIRSSTSRFTPVIDKRFSTSNFTYKGIVFYFTCIFKLTGRQILGLH